MNNIFKQKTEPYLQSENVQLFCEDSFELLKKIKPESVDMVFADPPYFLSSGGISCSGGKQVSVNKGDWDKSLSLKDRHSFHRRWIRQCKRVLKPDGTIWISATLHSIYVIGYALEQEGFKIINNITWQKTNPPPNIACRCFTHSTETILWAKKEGAKHYFDYPLMKEINGGKQMKDVWAGSLTKPSEKSEGKHPTQKPLYLLERILLASSREGDLILDPFCGSGTTGVAAVNLGRNFIGVDNSREYIDLAKRRIEKEINNEKL